MIEHLVPVYLLMRSLSAQALSEAEAEMVLSTLKPYQRTYAVTRYVDDTIKLLAEGYSSATSIAASIQPPLWDWLRGWVGRLPASLSRDNPKDEDCDPDQFAKTRGEGVLHGQD